MPDDVIEKLIFSGEFNPTDFIKGIDATIAASGKLQQKASELTETVQQQGKEFDDNTQRMKKLEAELNQLKNSQSSSVAETKKLRDELKNLTAQNDSLTKSLQTNISQLEKTKKQNDDLQKAYAKTRQEVQQFQEQAGKPVSIVLDDNATLTKLQQLKANFDKTFGNGFGLLAQDELAKIDQAVIESKGDFEVFSKTVDVLKDKLLQLEPGTAEFNDLSQAIKAGNAVLGEYTTLFTEATEATVDAEPKYRSLRQQIMLLRNELTKMEEAGQEETEQYRKTQLEAAKLTDQYGDMRNRIKILSSDTRGIDFGVAAIQAAAVGYQALTGAMELFGVSSETSEAAQRKLLAVMNLVQGVDQLANILNKDSIIIVEGKNAANLIYAATQRLVASTTLVSAEATEAWTAALLTTGIGAIVVGLGYLISKMMDVQKETERAGEQQKNLTAIETKAADTYAETTLKLQLLIDRVKEGGLSFTAKERAVREYNDEFGKTLGAVKDYAELEKKLIESGPDYIRYLQLKSKAQAAFELAVESSKKALIAEQQVEEVKKDNVAHPLQNKALAQNAVNDAEDPLNDANRNTKFFTDQQKLIEDEAQALADKLKLVPGTVKEAKKGVENEFAKQLADLKAKLAEVTEKTLSDDDTIRDKIVAGIASQYLNIDQLLKDKKLTKPQSKILKTLIGQIGDAELAKELDDYFQKVKEARTKLNDALQGLFFDEGDKRLANIRDENARETATIIQEYNKQAGDLQTARNNAFAELEKDFADGIFGNPKSNETIAVYEKARLGYSELYDRLADDLVVATAQKRQDLSAKIFQELLTSIGDATAATEANLSEQSQRLISKQTEFYLSGKITYSEYQKALTKIAKDENDNRLHLELASIREQQAEIALRQNKVGISEQEYNALQKQYDGLDAKASEIQGKIDTGAAGAVNTQATERLKRLQKYVDVSSQIIQSIIGAYQAANEAEQKSIERSLALQDKRVSDAQKIADRGNASYLKMEEEKQQELLLRQENAARRQMAINAAIQASQLLVAITGAVSHIAADPTGIIVFENIAVIIGALASGYALVKSLQQNQPSFAEGTSYARRDARKNISNLDRQGEPSGRDTIPAWLDEGEAVTDAKTNKLYHPTIRAIHEGKIPASVINGVVNSYPKWSMPQLSTKRMSEAISVQIKQDERQVEATRENTREVKNLHRTMKKLGVVANLDSKGFSLAVTGYQMEQELNKKS